MANVFDQFTAQTNVFDQFDDTGDAPAIPGEQPPQQQAATPVSPIGRVGAAFAEPFKETQFGIPEAGIQAFQRPGGAFNAFNDLVVRGVASPAFSAIQALGVGSFAAIDALAQVAMEAGVDRTKAQSAANDIKGLLEIVPAVAGVAAPAAASRSIARQASKTERAFPQSITRNVAEAVITKTAPKVAGAAPSARVVSKVDGFAFKKLRNTLAKDVGSKGKADDLLKQWAEAGGDSDALIDLGGANMKRLARRTADISPDKALKKLTQFVQEQPEQIRGQVARTVSKGVGKADDVIDDIQFIKATQGSDKYKAIEGVLIPADAYDAGVRPLLKTTLGKQAVRQARKIADFDGDSDMVDTLDLVLKGEEPTLSIRAIQMIKEEGLDDIIGKAQRKGGKTSKMTARKNEWLKAIDDAVPDYKDAREFYAGQFETEEAITAGREFMRPGKSSHIIKREIADMNPSEKEFYRVGVADSIDDFIARKGDTSDKAKLIKSESMRRKIKEITEGDPEAANEFIDFLQASSEQFERRRFISPDTGSQTASRASGLIEAGVVDLATGGGAMQTVRGGARAVAAAARTKARKEIYEDLADAFFVDKPLATGGQ